MCEYVKNKKFLRIMDKIITNNLPRSNTKPNMNQTQHCRFSWSDKTPNKEAVVQNEDTKSERKDYITTISFKD